VIHEASLRDRTSVRAPDYCFRWARSPASYVEAKKPSVDIAADIRPAYQLRSYAWTRTCPSPSSPISRSSPSTTASRAQGGGQPGVAARLLVRYETYPDRWDEIARSFPTMPCGGATMTPMPKPAGQAAALKRSTTSSWRRSRTAAALAAQHRPCAMPSSGCARSTMPLQQTIGPHHFPAHVRDRDIEPYEQLKAPWPGRAPMRADGALSPRRPALPTRALSLSAGKGARGSRCPLPLLGASMTKCWPRSSAHLYYPHSPYAFRVLSADILGNVYERFWAASSA